MAPENEIDIEKLLTPDILKGDAELRSLLEEYKDLDREMRRRKALSDPLYLGREVLGYKDLQEYGPYAHIRSMLLREGDFSKPFNLICVPRDCLKTTYGTITHCIWLIVNNPNIRILIDNAIMDNARKMLHEIKSHLAENSRFIELFGNYKGPIWREDEITVHPRTVTCKEMTIEITSPNNTKTSKHYDYIKADDLVVRENISTPDAKEKIYKHFMDLLDLLDHPHGLIDVIGTRWDFGDLYSHILDPERPHLSDFNIYIMPCENVETGELYFPWKLNRETINFLKRNKSSLEFSAQYMNNPISSNDAKFTEAMFKDNKYAAAPDNKRRYFLVDPAATKNKKSDYSTGIILDVDQDNKWYLRDAWRDKLLPGELEMRCFKTMREWRPDESWIESVGFQAYVRKGLYRLMKENNNYFFVGELEPKGRNKDDRILGLEPKFRNTEILFPAAGIKYITTEGRQIDVIYSIIDEFLKFPRSSKRDLMDIMAYGLDVCKPPQKAKPIKQEYMGTDNLTRREFEYRKRRLSEKKRVLAGLDFDDYE